MTLPCSIFHVPAAFEDGFKDYVHIVYGLSKDFCLNGFRIGILYSENSELLSALQSNSFFSYPSNLTQGMLANMLDDDTWVEWFLKENQSRLRHAYAHTST